ncbi:MAG: acyltransferase domain-containing protein [Actinocatenispora sp.]
MSIAFVLGQKNVSYDPAGLIAFYETEPKVKAAYDLAAETTGMDVDKLLRNLGDDEQERRSVASVGLAAAMVGIHDVLRERGVQPSAIGGLSLGTIVSSCLAGSLGRRDLFDILYAAEQADKAVPGERTQGCAGAVLPVGCEYDSFYGGQDGIWLAGDFGMHESGAFRMLLLSGYLDSLQEAASKQPKEYFVFSEEVIAHHCPLRQHVADLVAEKLKKITLTDPELRLCSCLERRTLTAAAEVEEMLVRNVTNPVYLDHLSQEMISHGAKLGVALGPTLPKTYELPFPVVHVESPKDLDALGSAALAAGITL